MFKNPYVKKFHVLTTNILLSIYNCIIEKELIWLIYLLEAYFIQKIITNEIVCNVLNFHASRFYLEYFKTAKSISPQPIDFIWNCKYRNMVNMYKTINNH